MNTPVPNLDSVWSWLVGIVPPDWQPVLGIFFTLAIGAWLLAKGLKVVLDLVHAWQSLERKRKVEAEPAPPSNGLPPPRVSVWNSDPLLPPRPKLVGDGGIPIVTTANMKGGVGKTTLTANLAAYLDARGKRVLIIDLDYQGSLSQTMLAAANITKMGSAVDDLVRGTNPMSRILTASQSLAPALPNSRILTCYYEFADTETHEMVDWLVGVRTGRSVSDLRFRLTSLLLDASVQEHYDIVLIDAPPRFSTATINALCASTHLLIPTVLDQMSAEAVIYFSRDVSHMRNKLFPNLGLIGVVPTLVYQSKTFTKREQGIIDHLNRSLQPYWGVKEAVLKEAFVPRKNSIGDVSGTGIGYVNAGTPTNTRAVREIFERVGKEIRKRIGAEITKRSAK